MDATRKDTKASFMVVSRCLVLVIAGEEEGRSMKISQRISCDDKLEKL